MDSAGLLVDWARLQKQTGEICEHMGEARVPADASQRTVEKMLEAAAVNWLSWQRGRGWRLISDLRFEKPRPTFDAMTGKVVPHSLSYKMVGMFEHE